MASETLSSANQDKTVEILVENGMAHQTLCQQDPLIFSPETITHELTRLSERDPYFFRKGLLNFSRKVTTRILRRYAQALSRQWEVPKDAIFEATFFYLWTELCTVMPIHHW